MRLLARSLTFAAVAAAATSASALGQGPVVVVGGPPVYVSQPVAFVPRITLAQRVFGPRPVYVAAPAPVVYAPRTVVMPTARAVANPTPVYRSDPALAPVGYEVIRPNGRTKVVYPRRVVRYAN